ncbi:MAG: SIS domain-containing protein [Promethearchaeota archaeon]
MTNFIMTADEIYKRFHNTMLELANQVKINAKTFNKVDLLSVIKIIVQVHQNDNRIFLYGAGRSGFIGRCFAQRLMHLGIKSCFISDAVTHQYTNKDLLILISGSGRTTSTVAIAKKAKQIGGKIVTLSTNLKSEIAKLSDYIIEIKGKSKDLALIQDSLAPYTSLFDISVLAFLDSIGGVLMKNLHITEKDINRRHASIE